MRICNQVFFILIHFDGWCGLIVSFLYAEFRVNLLLSSLLTVIDAQRLCWKASDHCIDQLLRLAIRIPAVSAWLRANPRKWSSILDWLAMFPQVPNGAHGSPQLRLLKPSRKPSNAETLLLVSGHPYASAFGASGSVGGGAGGVYGHNGAAAAAAGLMNPPPLHRTDQYVSSGLPPPRKQAALDAIAAGKQPHYELDDSDDGNKLCAMSFQFCAKDQVFHVACFIALGPCYFRHLVRHF